MTRIRKSTLSYHRKCWNFSLESLTTYDKVYMPRPGWFLGMTFESYGFRFIHGFYTSISILNILKGSLQPKLKKANVWPFNAHGKVARGWVYHTWSLYRYCKEKIDQTQLQWYLWQFLRAPAGPGRFLGLTAHLDHRISLSSSSRLRLNFNILKTPSR